MKSDSKYDCLKLENQLCFPLYACAREIVRKYKPFLDEINLTYTQYISMMVLWEEQCMSVKSLGEKLYLDSGTLTPLLKNLEKKGFVKRQRSDEDERIVQVTVTAEGIKLREKAVSVPQKIAACMTLSKEEAESLYVILKKILSDSDS